MRSSPFTIVDCSYVLQHHCLWQYRIMLFSKTQSLYKRFDGAVAPKDRNKKTKKRVSKDMCVVPLKRRVGDVGRRKRKCQVLGNGTQRAKKRGVEDIFIACTDNLTGFSAAIGAVFPKTEIQNCIIHQLRNSSKYVTPFLNPKTKATVLF